MTEISRADAERLSDTRSPQGVFAVIDDHLASPADAIAALPSEGPVTVVALDAVQDPGNVGAIIRSAAAFGCALVLLGPGCADVTHARVTRAATGAWFHVPLARSEDLAADLATLREGGARADCRGERCDPLSRFASAPPGAARASGTGTTVYLFGNEGAGISEGLAELVDETISVPISPNVESLNVAVAAGIILSHTQQAQPEEGPS